MFFLFEFILVLNLGGLVPGSAPVTAMFAITFLLSKLVWCESVILGLEIHGLFFFAHFYLKEKIMLGSFLSLVELLSLCIRLLTLAVRLYANITAGHILLETLFSSWYGGLVSMFSLNTTFYFSIFVYLLIFPVAAMVLMFYETCVAFVQAYVFVLLAIYYLREPIKMLSHGHDEEWDDYYDMSSSALYLDPDTKVNYWLPDGNPEYLKYIDYPDHVRRSYEERFLEDSEKQFYQYSKSMNYYAKYKIQFSSEK